MFSNDPEAQAIRSAAITEEMHRSANEYRESRRIRDETSQAYDAALERVDALFDELYLAVTGRTLADRFRVSTKKRRGAS